MTSSIRESAAGKLIGAFVLVAACSLTACGGGSGDTDGGSAVDQVGLGDIPVSNGGFGALLTLSVDGVPSSSAPTVGVGEIVEFTVRAQDPRGQALAYQRVACESERGVAIIEPSSGGVAFEHTNRNGYMSGFVGCITKGSFLLECRLGQGFGLVARQHVRCVGDGSANFAGAAGGHLGGGNLVEGDPAATGTTGAVGVTGATGATGATS